MKRVKKLLKRFIVEESGSPAVEYSMIATVIAVALVAAFMGLGDGITALFNGNESSIGTAIDGALGS
jgi:Flp pilus assembly pilin Flp